MTATNHLTCCICGAAAGRWAQHWNRDTGYGICASCAAEQAGRETPGRLADLYGQPGVNYEQPTVTIYNRVFNVMATFHDTEDGTRRANAYMERTPGASVLEVRGGTAYLAHQEDLGRSSR